MLETMVLPIAIATGNVINTGTMEGDDYISNYSNFTSSYLGWEIEPIDRFSPGEFTAKLSDESFTIKPVKQDLVAARLMSYLDLKNGWDGFGGMAPTSSAVSDALEFLRQVPGNIPVPQPMLSGDGEVGLLWKRGEVYIDIGFIGDKLFSYYAEGENGLKDENENIQIQDKIHYPMKLEQIFLQLT